MASSVSYRQHLVTLKGDTVGDSGGLGGSVVIRQCPDGRHTCLSSTGAEAGKVWLQVKSATDFLSGSDSPKPEDGL